LGHTLLCISGLTDIKQTEAGLLNKSSYLAAALAVTKLETILGQLWSHFVVQLKSEAGFLNKSSC